MLMYDSICTLYADDVDVLKRIANSGARPSQVCLLASRYLRPHIASFVPSAWKLQKQDVVHALSCLEVAYYRDKDIVALMSHLCSTFKLFPNLAELAIHGHNSLDNDDLKYFFDALVQARALRVLRISEWTERRAKDIRSFIYKAHELRVNGLFPASFEYFVWTALDCGEPACFRFLPTFNKTTPVPASTSEEGASLPKRGRLQRIPSMFRTKISPLGIWDQPFDPARASAILDHSGVVPSLNV
ncbi:unnamed protein product [Tilletia controversa]|nr:unnamed protein product [Tilletia controversa]